ncbi:MULTISPECIES: protein kinase [unclassified Streptomyces]|uniref:protein kinase domain-containing protein n=1 Tax=unclassified Streptomyces TaxID=2593676 RepID=UPI0036E49595
MTEPFGMGGMGVFALNGELRQLGPYRLLGQLATGGMGVVYLGRVPGSGRIAAVKTLLASGGVTEEARRRFSREVGLARRVTNAYTAQVLDFDVDADRPWMAMEYVAAPSLEALVVQKGPLADERAVRRMASGVARALAELHDKSIVHRDVKPLNILLCSDGPKVIDFGISHAGDLTSTKLTLGTIAFAAPEQAEGQPSSPASDIYSLGVTLYYVACGKLPYPPTTEPLQQLNYVRQAAIDLHGLPSGLEEVVRDCVAARPEDRPTADQLVPRFEHGAGRTLPAGWTWLVEQYAEEGRRLQRAADQAEAETVTRSWTAGPKATRRRTEEDRWAGAPEPGRPEASGPGPNPAAGPRRSSPAGEPSAGTGGTTPRRVRWKNEYLYALLSAAALVVSLIIYLNSDSANDSPTSSPTHTSSPLDDAESGGGPDSEGSGGSTTSRPSPTPPSREDEAFADIAINDCLDNYRDLQEVWSPDTPQAASCNGTGSYYRVMSIADDSGDCSAGYDAQWSHDNNDDTTTALCLNRNYRVGQCVFMEGDKSQSLGRRTLTHCDGEIPDDYKYIVRITGVYADRNDCGNHMSWTLDDRGITLCGDKL